MKREREYLKKSNRNEKEAETGYFIKKGTEKRKPNCTVIEPRKKKKASNNNKVDFKIFLRR